LADAVNGFLVTLHHDAQLDWPVKV